MQEQSEVEKARKRLMRGKYLDWQSAGGTSECPHGYAAGIPCRACDEELCRRLEPNPDAEANAHPEECQCHACWDESRKLVAAQVFANSRRGRRDHPDVVEPAHPKPDAAGEAKETAESLLREMFEDGRHLVECNPQWPDFDANEERCPEGHEMACGACEMYYRIKNVLSAPRNSALEDVAKEMEAVLARVERAAEKPHCTYISYSLLAEISAALARFRALGGE